MRVHFPLSIPLLLRLLQNGHVLLRRLREKRRTEKASKPTGHILNGVDLILDKGIALGLRITMSNEAQEVACRNNMAWFSFVLACLVVFPPTENPSRKRQLVKRNVAEPSCTCGASGEALSRFPKSRPSAAPRI
jgi:hypothetical protein